MSSNDEEKAVSVVSFIHTINVCQFAFGHAISFINLVKFINYYQMPRSISSKLFVIASGGGEANVYGSSYY
jgi:hypothetical protein